jgi:uncharacterized membrane protein
MRTLANSMLLRIGISLAGAIVVGLGFALAGHPAVGVMAGWATLAALFTVLTWLAIGRLDPRQTRDHAKENDPSDGMAGTLVIIASLASIVGVGFLLAGTRHNGQASGPLEGIVGVAVVVASWAAVHTIYVLRYARIYYSAESNAPIDFHSDDKPDYQDFAYVAYTLGMTYQVSDTDFTQKEIRHVALRHGLISYVFGAVILATTINLVVQLASG